MGGYGTILATVGSVPIIPNKSALPVLVMGENRMLQFALPHRAHVTARLFDLRGRRLAVVLDAVRETGVYRLAMPRVTGGGVPQDGEDGALKVGLDAFMRKSLPEPILFHKEIVEYNKTI